MLGIPVENVAVNELGGLGDAMCSAVGTGLYKDFQEAFDHMSKPGKRFEPRIDQTAIYDRKYKAYESVLRVTDAGWNTLTHSSSQSKRHQGKDSSDSSHQFGTYAQSDSVIIN